ncbi:MAG: YihA family ribosome biogenesis GTP-binding protein [Desulfobacteraceae bacterium]|nr:YihA family ribosome biogenesis GTP-binding protein [Desulfobacteraceae bacterium]
MIIKSAEFVKSCVNSSHYPSSDLPEIAFIGRSNVGKSSLINTLVNRKRLVKTSSTPGRTQLINFFDINNAFSFVDLPGFGYAKVPAKIKKTWEPMIKEYLSERENLKGLVFIMDLRRIPGQEEIDLIDWFHQIATPVILVLTKADKLKKSKVKAQLELISKALFIGNDEFIIFSAKTRQGKENVWVAVEELINQD